jgi:hypothetical protein
MCSPGVFLPPAHKKLMRQYTWALFQAGPGRAGPRKSLTQYFVAQARPGPTVGPQIPAQAQPVGLKNHRAVGLSGRACSNSSFFPAQAWPVTPIGPKNLAQARTDSMLWPDGPGHFRAGPVGPGCPCPAICAGDKKAGYKQFSTSVTKPRSERAPAADDASLQLHLPPTLTRS